MCGRNSQFCLYFNSSHTFHSLYCIIHFQENGEMVAIKKFKDSEGRSHFVSTISGLCQLDLMIYCCPVRSRGFYHYWSWVGNDYQWQLNSSLFTCQLDSLKQWVFQRKFTITQSTVLHFLFRVCKSECFIV